MIQTLDFASSGKLSGFCRGGKLGVYVLAFITPHGQNSEMSESSDELNEINKFYLLAINVVFAVVVGLSFDITAKLSLPSEIISILVKIFTLLLIYYVVFSSWLGHYRPQSHWPYSIGLLGKFRFVISLSILYIYYHAFYLFANNSNGLFYYVFPLIFVAYFAYDTVKNIEYKDDTENGVDLINRLLITLLFLAFFIIASYTFYLFTTDDVPPILDVGDLDSWKIEFLTIFAVLIGVYRIKKRRIKSELRFTT
jgi:hypothetical protein